MVKADNFFKKLRHALHCSFYSLFEVTLLHIHIAAELHLWLEQVRV